MAVVSAVLSAAGCSSTSPGALRAAPRPGSPVANVSTAPPPTGTGAAASPAPTTSPGTTASPAPAFGGTGPTTSTGSATGSAPANTGPASTVPASTVPAGPLPAGMVPGGTGPVGTGSGNRLPAVGAVPIPGGAPAISLAGPIVALGDSFTAGDLLPLSAGNSPFGCYRSSATYPHLVATALHDAAGLVVAACASAGVADMTAAQHTRAGVNPPQFNSLSENDSLVMLTLGGDDLGFSNVLTTCIGLSWTNPWGSPCERHFTSGGTDQLAARVTAEAPKMAVVLAAIRQKVPRARVLLVGYPDLFPLHGGCWPAVPITDGDIGYLRGIELRFNAVLAKDAAAAGVTFVDTYDPTVGHDFCQRSSVRDVEGLVPATLTTPFHPNSRGQAAIAAQVLKAVGA